MSTRISVALFLYAATPFLNTAERIGAVLITSTADQRLFIIHCSEIDVGAYILDAAPALRLRQRVVV